MASISIHDDLSGGWLLQDDLSEHILGDGDTITVYGCRYVCGMDYGDGDGCMLKKIGLHDYPHHNTLDDLDTTPEIEVYKVMTVGQYKAANPDFTGYLEDANGVLLDDDALVSIFADNTYCAGQYDGNQSTMPLF
jgi:hypothetical protein